MLEYPDGLKIPYNVRFWLLLISDIPSLACSIFIIWAFIIDRTLRYSLAHHPLLISNLFVLIYLLIDVSFYLNFTTIGYVWPQHPAMCLTWRFADIATYSGCCILVAWASIERHILVFHDRWLATRTRRFLLHYLPLTVILVYVLIYYIVVLLLPREKAINYRLPACGITGFYQNYPLASNWELIGHGCTITAIIIIFSGALLFRFLRYKHRVNPRTEWRKCRKLTLQLLFVVTLFLIFNLPMNLLTAIAISKLSFRIGFIIFPYLYFSAYWLIFLAPFVFLHSIPNVKQKFRRLYCVRPFYRRNTRRTLATTS